MSNEVENNEASPVADGNVAAKAPRDKYKSKGVRGVLVNLDLELAAKFYELAKVRGSKPTKVARELLTDWVNSNS